VFLLVLLSTFPVVLPFVFLNNLYLAMRVSALIAITIMYLCGYGWGRYAGLRPGLTGAAMVLLGVIIEAVIILLGG
jgi:VIT1/CCC1 family predicted Fe2+/Mn2+ transporter